LILEKALYICNSDEYAALSCQAGKQAAAVTGNPGPGQQ
jgi:hypothetical protein